MSNVGIVINRRIGLDILVNDTINENMVALSPIHQIPGDCPLVVEIVVPFVRNGELVMISCSQGSWGQISQADRH